MKKKLYTIFFVVHVFIIAAVCITSSYAKYCEFNRKKPWAFIGQADRWLFSSKLLNMYMRFSGTEAGYGFFAPNVRSHGLIIGQHKGEICEPPFRSFEGRIRFAALSGTVTDNLMKQLGDTSASKKTEAQTAIRSYYDLVLKNIAGRTFRGNSWLPDSVSVSYNLIDFPLLSEANKMGTIIPNLVRVKEIKLLVKN